MAGGGAGFEPAASDTDLADIDAPIASISAAICDGEWDISSWTCDGEKLLNSAGRLALADTGDGVNCAAFFCPRATGVDVIFAIRALGDQLDTHTGKRSANNVDKLESCHTNMSMVHSAILPSIMHQESVSLAVPQVSAEAWANS